MNSPNSCLETLQKSIVAEGSPTLLALTTLENKVVISLFVPDKLSWFEGHFPEQAVLPGVVQLHWAGTLSQLLFDELSQFKGINNLKYKAMVLPNTTLDLTLEYKEEKQQIRFAYQNEENFFSSGTLQF